MLAIRRLTEDLAFAFRDGVAADDDAPLDAASDVLGLLKGKASDKLLRRFGLALWGRPRFGRVARGHDGEVIAGLRQELAAAGRGAGEDQGRGGHINFLVFVALKLAIFS